MFVTAEVSLHFFFLASIIQFSSLINPKTLQHFSLNITEVLKNLEEKISKSFRNNIPVQVLNLQFLNSQHYSDLDIEKQHGKTVVRIWIKSFTDTGTNQSSKKMTNKFLVTGKLHLAFKILALPNFLQIHLTGVSLIPTQLHFQGNCGYYICSSLITNTHLLVKTQNTI